MDTHYCFSAFSYIKRSILGKFYIPTFKQTQKTGRTILFFGQSCLCFYNPFANVFNSAAISGFANSFIRSS